MTFSGLTKPNAKMPVRLMLSFTYCVSSMEEIKESKRMANEPIVNASTILMNNRGLKQYFKGRWGKSNEVQRQTQAAWHQTISFK